MPFNAFSKATGRRSPNGDAAANVDTRAVRLSECDSTGEFPVLPMTPPDPEGVREIGDVLLSRYVLREHLGRGRYGEVYEAVDRSFSDPQLCQEHAVALHLLSERISCQTRVLQNLEACYHEPQLWSHPNLVEVRGFGCDRGQFFVVTELLRGLSLRSVLDDAPGELLADDEALAVIRGVGDALKYGHAKGAIHGGLRPEKVFITADRAVKVLDYLPTTVPRTAPFFVEDAVTLAAPEERDDVYSLACLAYELLTGGHPYNSNTPLEAWNARLTLVPIPRIGEQRWSGLARALALCADNRTANVATFLADFGIKGDEKLRPGSDADPVREPTPSPRWQDDGAPVIGDHASAARAAKRPPSEQPPQTAPPLQHVVADFDRYPGFARRSGRREPRRGNWRFTVGVALVAAVVASFLYSEPLQRRAEQWLATMHSYLDDIPRGSGEPPALTNEPASGAIEQETLVAPEIVAATPNDWPNSAEQLPAEPSVARTEPTAHPAPEQTAAPGAPAPSIAEPEIIEFAARTVTVSEGQTVARVAIRRRGGVLGGSPIVWWASEGTAFSDDDYGYLGARIERFDAGADTHTLYVPIANDSMHENLESFFVDVRAGEDSGRRAEPAQRIEILITDDD